METNEEKTSEPAGTNTNEGSERTTTPLIDSAYSAAKRLEEANKQTEELIRRQEALMARSALGGRSEAGVKPKSDEDLESEEADKVVSAWYS